MKEEFTNEDPVRDDIAGAEDMTNNQTEETPVADINDNVTDWETKYNELNDSYLRLNAEFDNYRKRTLKEKAELLKSGSERVLIDIIAVVDDFERALENISKTEDIAAVKEGVDLIYTKFLGFLSRHGVKEIETIGQPFDTDRHEAITTVPAQKEEDKDKIVDSVQKGYTLDDKVIRYPKVIVAK
ncbi:molecular chaperone GrpE [Dysgonomonas sp. PFB1-18]|uniref:nucleotide exchange factor GrpE n=1 Tax=unclassified Dysgonomonas TaxID=2630389 RepID=UPI0024730AD8|nr:MULTISPECIES: nucleotide exchange factor GrpE [unclassified Dysgonomonas]MDH6308300.1 molecular chaperone GrpE [Dysgonomonas sp. PF1-14]MDH6338262.1 molecular chaperone GrpE [Dysgonomonas sp. PF1-16]MDH6379759.1 molecular chaperone GrpE [Dysgonomonas sp. PFB1-18]MDH6397151.1 molecular chaperone GrpE [Dysgonomonas sp. PF1-23]